MGAEMLSESVDSLLIVDDEPLMTDLFYQAMSRRGFRVLKATGGEDALRLVGEETVDLVITDMSMPPGMDGAALSRALYDIRAELPVLIATGHDADTQQLDVPPNVKGVIRKPYQHKVLAEQIRKILHDTDL